MPSRQSRSFRYSNLTPVLMQVAVSLKCPVHDSFRVQQVAGLFDVPPARESRVEFRAELPLEEDWQLGLIVGPSGSGKTSLARAALGASLAERKPWPSRRAVIDEFHPLPVRETARLLTAVGFGSPPAWVRPYHALSGGEQFRCDLARALLPAATADAGGPPPLIGCDEFSSLVDRRTARLGAAALAKSIRGGLLRCRFVAVTCHRDVARRLAPDWTLELPGGSLHRRRLRRPEIRLCVARCRHAAWKLFARHHYLSGALNPLARCHWATWRNMPVAFCATLPLIGRRRHWRITRLVTLPDFQGLGIGGRLARAVAELHTGQGQRVSITTGHPGFIAHARRAAHWRCTRLLRYGSRRFGRGEARYRGTPGRAMASFEFVPSAATGP